MRVKEASHKRSHSVWFHPYERLGIGKSTKTRSRLGGWQGPREVGGGQDEKPWPTGVSLLLGAEHVLK